MYIQNKNKETLALYIISLFEQLQKKIEDLTLKIELFARSYDNGYLFKWDKDAWEERAAANLHASEIKISKWASDSNIEWERERDIGSGRERKTSEQHGKDV